MFRALEKLRHIEKRHPRRVYLTFLFTGRSDRDRTRKLKRVGPTIKHSTFRSWNPYAITVAALLTQLLRRGAAILRMKMNNSSHGSRASTSIASIFRLPSSVFRDVK